MYLWVRGLMVAEIRLEIRDLSSIPNVYQITDNGLMQVVYIVP